MALKTSHGPAVRAEKHPLIRELQVTLTLFVIATGIFMVLELLNMADNSEHLLEGRLSVLHESGDVFSDAGVVVTLLNDVEEAVTADQQNARLMSFLLSTNKAAKVESLRFSLGEMANPEELKSLQLYADGEFLTERAFFEGHGTFHDLHLRLHPGSPVVIDVTGQIQESAQPGHRLQIGFASEDDVVMKSIVSEPLETNLDFPVWGPSVSIIGKPL